MLLSRFQLELASQALALQYRAAALSSAPLQPKEWPRYADMWRLGDISDTPASLAQVRDATDMLAALYESMLSTAAAQPDQATSFYLLAEHLVALNKYCLLFTD